jgi:hypothetical protein
MIVDESGQLQAPHPRTRVTVISYHTHTMIRVATLPLPLWILPHFVTGTPHHSGTMTMRRSVVASAGKSGAIPRLQKSATNEKEKKKKLNGSSIST